jgi:hypothetical protein
VWGADPISFRVLKNLTVGLPHESRTLRALGAPTPGAWGNVEELLAGIIDEQRVSNFYFVSAHVKQGTQVPEPKLVKRPTLVPRTDEPGGQDRPRPLNAEGLATALGKGRGVVRYTPKAGD